MKKLRTLLTLLVVSICAVQNAWADRSAPVLPEAVAPESGNTYYLYNVMEDKFLCQSSSNVAYVAIGTYGNKITITATDTEGEYTIQWTGTTSYPNYYLKAFDSYVDSEYSKSNLSYFLISESAKGYSIQRSPKNISYYKADEYLGYNGTNGDRITPALAEGSIHWKFISVDDAEYYFAKHKLYTALNVADQYNFYITQYENVYNDPNSTTEQLNLAQETLNDALSMSSNYVSPEWTDYPILFQNTTENKWKLGSGSLSWYLLSPNQGSEYTSTLMGTVNVDEDVTLVYDYQGSAYSTLRVYLDGELVQNIPTNVASGRTRSYYLEMPAGKHDISWTCIFNSSVQYGGSYSHYLSNIGIEKTPTITTPTLTVEGQLGTEILKFYDNIAEVRKIVINGVIGADDWTTIGLLKNAFTIDMSGATAVAGIPESLLTKTKLPFLHSIKLPQGLTYIGASAFYNSDIEDEITFPNSLESIGQRAFCDSKIKAAYMPNSVTSVGYSCFYDCYYLENASWSSAAAEIPSSCFYDCWNLRTFEIPEGVTTVMSSAFYKASLFNPRFPSTLELIEYYAFSYTATDQLVIHENMEVRWSAFSDCSNLEYAEWPTTFYRATQYASSTGTNGVTTSCPKLKDVYLKSPTVVTYDTPAFFYDCTLSEINLHVPSYLVNAYKLDPYWYQCNVVGFNTADVTNWRINTGLTLNEGQRIEGTPNIAISCIAGSSLTVNGDDPMTINNFYVDVMGTDDNSRAMVIGNTNNVSIGGEFGYNYYTYKNNWYFITLPFDVKVSNITSPGCSKAVRYYDGATRAELGTGSSWKNYAQDDIIPAGTGFIYQTSQDTWSTFKAENNASKQYVFSKNEFVKELEANPSEVTANKGWNLVGNPWLSYYNIHKLNFTAPITVWNVSNRNYSAYSIIDDDYAILPSQAFFVQCPDEVNSISFPIDGRQLTDVIESQVGAREFGESASSERKLIDIELSNGERSDKTRFVLNPKAKLDYETSCDASKFFSMDAEIPQIYTIQNGVQMAINERPAGDGIIKIGFVAPTRGSYTISTNRSMLEKAILVDLHNGTETNLNNESYTFNAENGISDSRFELRLSAGETTGIAEMKANSTENENCYNLNGQRIAAPQKGVYVVNGKKVIMK